MLPQAAAVRTSRMKQTLNIHLKRMDFIFHIALCLALVGITAFFVWTSWLSLDPTWDPRSHYVSLSHRIAKTRSIELFLYQLPPLIRAPLILLPALALGGVTFPGMLRAINRMRLRKPVVILDANGIDCGFLWDDKYIPWREVTEIKMLRPRLKSAPFGAAPFAVTITGKTEPHKWRKGRMVKHMATLSPRQTDLNPAEVMVFVRSKRPDLCSSIRLPNNFE